MNTAPFGRQTGGRIMGIYVNPGNTAFREAVNSQIYVDKSGLISYTNSFLSTKQKNICVSRPRRFGKTMAADMLAAYYSKGCDSYILFSQLEASRQKSFRSHLNRHNVIRLDIQRFLETEDDQNHFIHEIERNVVRELLETFPDCTGFDICTRLKISLEQIFKQTAQRFIFVIDEWDCVFRFKKNNIEIQEKYLNFLRGLFKGSDYVELAYMTGILPIKKYGEHSAINIFDEYSMIDPAELSDFYGFTEKEVQKLCIGKNIAFPQLQKWYDGYLLNGSHIYNPKSVADAVRRGRVKSYWTGTETYEALKVYINMNFDGMKETIIRMLGGTRCKINTRKFQNDMNTFSTKDDILTLLLHLGYLTFDEATEEAFIPNQEIVQEFLNVVDEPDWGGLIDALNSSRSLLNHTWALEADAVAEGIADIHSQTASLLKYNNENSLTCAILIAYYSAKAYYLNPMMELPSGKGFADVVYLPRRNINRPALVIELKWNQSAQGAIQQIKDRQYTSWIESYTGDILLVGINDHTKKKKHQCVIEKYVKL